MAERGRAPGRPQGIAVTWPPRGAAQAGGFAPSGFGAWPAFLDKLREWVRAEAGAGRLLPWVPIAFGAGIAFYFTADHEPVLPVAAVTAIGLCAAAFLLRRQRIFPVAKTLRLRCPPTWPRPIACPKLTSFGQIA